MPKYKPSDSSNTNKGIAWLYNEVCALLDVWSDPDVQQQLAGRLHNMCVYEKISGRLSSLGIERTAEQCREKIKKLKRDYKTVTDNNYSPAFARKLLGCFDKVHEVFGKCAVVKPTSVIESLVLSEQLRQDPYLPLSSNNGVIDDSGHNNKNGICSPNDSRGSDSDRNVSASFSWDTKFLQKEQHNEYIENILSNFSKGHKKCYSKICMLQKESVEMQLARERSRLQMVQRRRQLDRQRELFMLRTMYSMIVLKHKGKQSQCNGHVIHDNATKSPFE